MAKGSPSMIALLGLLAVAGYQNRDKLGAMLNSGAAGDPNRDQTRGGSQGGGVLDNLRDMADNLTGGRSDGGLTGAGAGGLGGLAAGGLMGGLSELMERFSNAGQQTKAQSWVSSGRNESIGPDELEQTLDEETIAELVEKTGLSRSELLSRLSQTLPEAVDQATPDGQFPPVSVQEPRSI
jgi:uncharacterized protein YidB (DUF937 family)